MRDAIGQLPVPADGPAFSPSFDDPSGSSWMMLAGGEASFWAKNGDVDEDEPGDWHARNS